MSMPPVAERLARHVADTGYAVLPEPAIAAAKSFILDTLGVAVAGASLPAAARLCRAAAGWGTGTDACVLGTKLRLPAPAAAFVNGYQIHCREFDCLHEGAVVHPMATVLAASLAFAERAGSVSGRELLLAIILGVDVAVTLGLAARAALRFFRPATAGAFGAIAALGKLKRLAVPELINGFGLVLAQVSGTMQPHLEGKALLPAQMGFNARNAVAAADLVAAGLEGPREVFEGRFGYLPLFEGDYEIEPALAELGRTWRIAELSHKPFPCGRATHGGIDALLALKARHGFAADEVERVTIAVPPLVAQLVGRPLAATPTPSFARLSLPYVGAVALLRGGVGLADFSTERLGDPAIHALAARIAVVVEETPEKNALLPQRVELRLKCGRSFTQTLAAVLGSPAQPLPPELLRAKFEACWRAGPAGLTPARAASLRAAVESLETLTDVAALTALATA